MESFAFVLSMMTLIKVLKLTTSLSSCLQKKDQDFVNACCMIAATKSKIQFLRDSGWDDIMSEAVEFCTEYDIDTPEPDE